MRRRLEWLAAGILLALGSAGLAAGLQGVDPATITGVVTSGAGPEAGVWVIAETGDLPTTFRKIVVTDDEGRFLLPDLPEASYAVWVRGYGLVDSTPVTAAPGQEVRLTAAVAQTPQEAAAVYPANYWLSLIEPPEASEFPGTGPTGNGISEQLRTRDEYLYNVKACLRCHQVGGKFTREHPAGLEYDSTADAWDDRVRMGQRGAEMSTRMTRFGRERGLRMFADWSDRIATGETPPAPPRPQGVERNLVLTQWEWTDEMGKIHDEASTDKRNPTVNANGPIYGVDIANDNLAMLDPATHTATMLRIPTLADRSTMRASYAQSGYPPSRLADLARFNPASIHNPMLDSRGRVWLHGDAAPAGGPAGLVQGRVGQPVRALLSAGAVGPQRELLRPRDAAVHDGRHLFRQPPPAVRPRRERDPVPESAEQCGVRLGRYEAAPSDRRRTTVAGLVPDRGRHQRRRPDHEAVERAGRGSRRAVRGGPDRKRVRLRPARGIRASRWGAYGIIVNPVDGSVWGAQDSYPGKIVPGGAGRRPAGELHRRALRSALGALGRGGERRGRLHAARHRRRPQTASSGRRSRGRTTSPASTAASAGRWPGPRRTRDVTAPKGGRCIRCRVPRVPGARTSGPTTTTTKGLTPSRGVQKTPGFIGRNAVRLPVSGPLTAYVTA